MDLDTVGHILQQTDLYLANARYEFGDDAEEILRAYRDRHHPDLVLSFELRQPGLVQKLMELANRPNG
eukprot:3244273-Alexandrium_andersonii.AAC.1